MTTEAVYWGLVTPEDNGLPEMFFATEAWAKQALSDLRAELKDSNPLAGSMVRIVRVRVQILAIEPAE